MKFLLLSLLVSFSAQAQILISVEPKESWTENFCLDLEPEEEHIPQYVFNAIKIIYKTRGPNGERITASGLLAMRNNLSDDAYITSVQHGTILPRRGVPSSGAYKQRKEVCSYASLDSYIAMPDYVGMGDSSLPHHPFLEAKTEGTASIDFLRAVTEYLATQNISYRNELAITGYSQGGHATVALQREIESDGAFPLELRISVPMAGPYALSTVGVRSILSTKYSKMTSIYSLYILHGMQNNFQVFSDSDWPVLVEYKTVSDLVNGGNSILAFFYAPSEPLLMYRSGFLDSLSKGENSDFYIRLKTYDLDHVELQSKTFIIASEGDEIVDYRHSLALYRHQNNASHVQLILLGRQYSHASGKSPSVAKSIDLIQEGMR